VSDLTTEQQEALIQAAIVIVVTVVGSSLVDRVLRRRERLILSRFPQNYAAVKTRYRLLKRVIISVIVALAVLSVLLRFDVTREVAGTIMASGAVIALIVGLAVRTPIANLAAGLQLAFTQPYRIGDRVTVSGETGVVEEIRIAHTVLRTDDQRRVFLPNESVIAQAIVNATIGEDEVRTLSVTFPVAPEADVARARQALLEAAAAGDGGAEGREPVARVTDVTPAAVIVTVTLGVRTGADVDEVASALRERGVARLAGEQLLAVGASDA
jgi:small-conductance mechanosensitive channel